MLCDAINFTIHFPTHYDFIEWKIVDWTLRDINAFNDYCGASDYNFFTS